MDNLRHKTVETYTVDIFIAGSRGAAAQICQKFCLEAGLCVTVSPTEFVYTGGAESGVRIGLVNYPRFPKTDEQIMTTAEELAMALIEGLYQHSALLVAPDFTQWITRRAE